MSLEQIRAFLEASEEDHFHTEGRRDIHAWVDRTLGLQAYPKLTPANKGLVHQYVIKMTGLSRAQVTRLVGQFGEMATDQQPYPIRDEPGAPGADQPAMEAWDGGSADLVANGHAVALFIGRTDGDGVVVGACPDIG